MLTDDGPGARYSATELVAHALRGGADTLQIRDKSSTSDRARILLARGPVALCRAAGRTVIINDRADIARALGADGVHVGPTDVDPITARQVVGPLGLVGATANTLEAALAIPRHTVDYLGVGPVFGTTSKRNPAPTLGLDGLRAITEAVRLPVIAIGAISPANALEVLRAGAAGLAVIAAVARADDPEATTRAFRDVLDTFFAGVHP